MDLYSFILLHSFIHLTWNALLRIIRDYFNDWNNLFLNSLHKSKKKSHLFLKSSKILLTIIS